jgi:drug/metabolite transporter (DMT)-like permease
MYTEPLDLLPLWGLFLAAAALLWLAMECGYRIGRWRRAQTPDEKDQPVGAMVASILGLLALVLGFTFSLAASRFEVRRQVVLEEANAIGTTYLRARLLPEPQRTELEKLLREYAAVRIQAPQEGKTAQAITRSEALHELLWAQAADAAKQDRGSIMTGVFIQSLNELIDLHAKRMFVGLRSRIPLVIWVGLFGLAMLGMAAVGYQSGLAATRRSPAMLGLVVAFSLVLYLIADLDRAHGGLLRIGQQAMIDVQRSMQPTPP